MADTTTSFAVQRDEMVQRQIESRGIRNPKILGAFRSVPREDFVADDRRDLAYGDHPLPIGAEQTISQPYIVALTIDAAEIGPGDRVLEVGAGSGYAAAVISRIAARVFAIERQPDLAKAARERLGRLGYRNVEIVEADGTRGLPDEAPFDAIVAAASGSHVPDSWVAQLAPGGRIVMPIGDPGAIQDLVKVTKAPGGTLMQENLCAVRFVPLVGEEGWPDGRVR